MAYCVMQAADRTKTFCDSVLRVIKQVKRPELYADRGFVVSFTARGVDVAVNVTVPKVRGASRK